MPPPFIDPITINPVNNGRIILTSQPDVVSDGIELREDGSWGLPDEVSHCMTLTKTGFFNCEDPNGFHQVPVQNYMTKGTNIYVFSFVNMNPKAYETWCTIVTARLGKEGYDFLQIFGQAVGLDFLHMPGDEDCSEEGVYEMKGFAPYMPAPDKDLIDSMSNQFNPQQVMNVCLNNPKIIHFDGVWS